MCRDRACRRAVSAILRIGGHVHTRPATIFIASKAICGAFSGRANLSFGADYSAAAAVARIVCGSNARRPALGETIIASDDAPAVTTLRHAVCGNITGVPASAAV